MHLVQDADAAACPCNAAMCNGSGGHVYFVGTSWHIKIGYTRHPLKRFKALQAGCPLVLEPLLLMPGTKDDEGAFHRRFSHLRIKHEWFRRSDGELDGFVGSDEMRGWAWVEPE